MKKLCMLLVSCSMFTMSFSMKSLENYEPKTQEGTELKEEYIEEIRAWLAPEDPTNLELVSQRLNEFHAAVQSEIEARKSATSSTNNQDPAE